MSTGLLIYSESVKSSVAKNVGTPRRSPRRSKSGGRALNAMSMPEDGAKPSRSRHTAPSDEVEDLTEHNTPWVSRPDGLADLHEDGYTGAGVTVAVIDSGITAHSDFGQRIKKFRDFSSRRRKAYDSKGHGTHVAGIIAGDGPNINGVAPEADLVACRITNEEEAIKAIDWVIDNQEKYSIDVLNLSLGVEPTGPVKDDAFAQAAERAVDAGLVVVVAAGNECKNGKCPTQSTISSPGTAPSVITVGALDDRGTAVKKDDKLWVDSSRGSRRDGKPDLIAVGSKILSTLAPDSEYFEAVSGGADYLAISGSSQAAPMVSGAAALMLQANPELTHDQIKDILMETADPVKRLPKRAQGSGRLDLDQAVEAALELTQE